MVLFPLMSLGLLLSGIMLLAKAGISIWAYFRTRALMALIYGIFLVVNQIFQLIIVPLMTTPLFDNFEVFPSGDRVGWMGMAIIFVTRSLPAMLEAALFIGLVVALANRRSLQD